MTADDCKREIRLLTAHDLIGKLRSGNRDHSMGKLDAGTFFEYAVIRAFEIEEATVQWPYVVKRYGDIVEQIDGAVHWNGMHALLESKDEDAKIGIAPIAKIRNQLARRPSGVVGIVFARKEFTEPAKALCRLNSPVNVLLWELAELLYAIEHRYMPRGWETKYLNAIERADPDFSILPVSGADDDNA